MFQNSCLRKFILVKFAVRCYFYLSRSDDFYKRILPFLMSTISERIATIQNNIASACERVNRDPGEVKIVVVTKSAEIEAMKEMLTLGFSEFGENRVQRLKSVSVEMAEFLKSQPQGAGLPEFVKWHMIGHLQRNKAKAVLALANVVHSVDTLRLAEEINSIGEKSGTCASVLMQVNASNEPQKYGVPVGAVTHLAEQINTMPHISLTGLMTMAPMTGDERRVRSCFVRTRELFAELKGERIVGPKFTELSMGMSNDYEIAVEEGATLLRLGSAIFKS